MSYLPARYKSESAMPTILWLSVSPALQRFDRPLLHCLAQSHSVAKWEYAQTLDEPNSFDAALTLLHQYLQQQDQPVHLVGHSTSGLLGLLYACQYPNQVKSLTLLSVGVQPAVDWQAHYYAQLQFLHCSRSIILAQMVYSLFGQKSRSHTQALINVLEQDLLTSLSPHTLFRQLAIAPTRVPVPLFIGGGTEDLVIDPHHFQGWQDWMQADPETNQIWLCPNGGHFFHYDHPDLTSQQIQHFWAAQSSAQPLFIHARPPA